MESFMSRIKDKARRIADQLLIDISKCEVKLREFIYTYMSKTVSILESIEFSLDLAAARKFRVTQFFLWLSIIVYRIESGIYSALTRKGK